MQDNLNIKTANTNHIAVTSKIKQFFEIFANIIQLGDNNIHYAVHNTTQYRLHIYALHQTNARNRIFMCCARIAVTVIH